MAIIDYGVGNLRSVEKAFHAAGCDAVVTGDPAKLMVADRLVLPGVGAFRACMTALCERGFDRLVLERVAGGTPLLGVCVGMQLLFERSEEFGETKGLGLLRGTVRRFSDDVVVPHVGWNEVEVKRQSSLLDDGSDTRFFYFVHSYFCDAIDANDVVATTEYGKGFASVVSRNNIFGVQFHPEKSQSPGLNLLRNFATRT